MALDVWVGCFLGKCLLALIAFASAFSMMEAHAPKSNILQFFLLVCIEIAVCWFIRENIKFSVFSANVWSVWVLEITNKETTS